MVVGCVIYLLANRKLRHRKLLLELSKTIIMSTPTDTLLSCNAPERGERDASAD
jgi:hypothetical protein